MPQLSPMRNIVQSQELKIEMLKERAEMLQRSGIIADLQELPNLRFVIQVEEAVLKVMLHGAQG